ncbi:hypothetical protein A2480_02175 [Candidatus Uhrbacteria bacterium RIFOXYC2_FULL_47_19]|uniref:PEP-utilising enzyme mobile domain-containing protein n=1 Tax=Candidatus Uhrbacteria bacterium RIFOXYC2_FULL_47_19 TaxID=1802424 RepID=A0A1F7WEX4_9BACT|nr:MAG: hypothetical protein A2480_02175 [Candidatus Uhrbacteria bacterium RIFOXYC2_FULL_47_19]HCC21858.1 hypothetical protein [Candidatus Uhrbacteria bacterium]
MYDMMNRPNHRFEQKSIIDHIKGQRWMLGVRSDSSLLFYTARTDGYRKHIGPDWGDRFADSMLVPIDGRTVRIINLEQAKRFHTISESKVVKNPNLLSEHIARSDQLYEQMTVAGTQLIKAISCNDRGKATEIFKELINLYREAGAEFILIFSLGLKLSEQTNPKSEARLALQQHDTWRNSVAFKEELLDNNLYHFFKYILKEKINLEPTALLGFLTISEAISWLEEKITDQIIVETVKDRSEHSYVFLDIKGMPETVLSGDDPAVKEITAHFTAQTHESDTQKNKTELTGQIAYGSSGSVTGEVIIVRNKSELDQIGNKADNKIIIAEQTTPHYIPYLKQVKAIITDEGGLTCHAAIVAREMKKPCIVGTKTATRVLRNGDLVEILLENGTIRILKRIGE